MKQDKQGVLKYDLFQRNIIFAIIMNIPCFDNKTHEQMFKTKRLWKQIKKRKFKSKWMIKKCLFFCLPKPFINCLNGNDTLILPIEVYI